MKEKDTSNLITQLELLERSNDMYVLIEQTIDQAESDAAIPYLFCRECSFRDLNNVQIDYQWEEELFSIPEEEGLKYSYIAKYGSQNLLNEMYKLYKIDKEFFSYYYHVLNHTLKAHDEDESQLKMYNYHVENIISRKNLEDALGKTRVDELNVKDCVALETIVDQLSHEEKGKILGLIRIESERMNKCSKFHTHIYRDLQSSISFENNHKNNNVFVELDLTRPLNEIMEYISKIKDDYYNDSKSIKNFFDLLDVDNPFLFDLKKSGILIHRGKTKGQRLADILYIYDCVRSGIDIKNNEEIKDITTEIELYYPEDTKNVMPKTIKDFYKFAKEYIDNGKYKHFISGYTLSGEDISLEPTSEENSWYNNIDNMF